MKKTLLLVLVLALAVSFAACGGKPNSPAANTPAVTQSAGGSVTPSAKPAEQAATAPDLSSAIGGSIKLSDSNDAARQAMIDEARKGGGNLEFRADGSVVYTNPDGSVIVQKPDGSWEYEDIDGRSASVQLGGNWPDNEFTRLLPKPDFSFDSAIVVDDVFNAIFSGLTVKQLKEYAEKVKAAGFKVDEETEEMDMQGMVVYTYSAKNADGYEALVFFSSGTSGVTVSKK